MAKEDKFADVKADAERLTKKRLEDTNQSVDNDLKIEPLVQAVTPNDAEAKKANTGGVEVSGSPEKFTGPVSDGFTDGADEQGKGSKASKTAK